MESQNTDINYDDFVLEEKKSKKKSKNKKKDSQVTTIIPTMPVVENNSELQAYIDKKLDEPMNKMTSFIADWYALKNDKKRKSKKAAKTSKSTVLPIIKETPPSNLSQLDILLAGMKK